MKKPDSNKDSSNGKGDKDRTASLSEFQKNYDKIKWQKPSGSSPNINLKQHG
jgi:hypothetical protein